MNKVKEYSLFAAAATEAVAMEHRYDEPTIDHYLQFARKILAEIPRSSDGLVELEASTVALAEALRKETEDNIPEQVRNTVYGYLIWASLPHVDWRTLAEDLLRHLGCKIQLQEIDGLEGGNGDEFTGGCPECGKTNGFLDVHGALYFYCHTHKVRWFRGENVFGCWSFNSPCEWGAKWKLMKEYVEVEPCFPRADETTQPKCEERSAIENSI